MNLGTVELKLDSTVKIQLQKPIFRFTHRVSHINTNQHRKSADNVMILIPEPRCAVVKSQGHLGNAGSKVSCCRASACRLQARKVCREVLPILCVLRQGTASVLSVQAAAAAGRWMPRRNA